MKTLFLRCLVGLVTFAPSHLFAQQSDSVKMSGEYYRMGMEVFDFTHRKQSTELFVMATHYDPTNARAQFMAGKSIMLTIRKEESLPYFKKAFALDPAVDEEIIFYLARGYQYAEKFDSAILLYDRFNKQLALTLNFDKSRRITDINRKIFECRNAKVFKANPVKVTITNLSDRVNSEWPDYAPNVTADESLMIFTSRRPEDNTNPSVAADHEYYEDIYYATNVNGEWQPAKNIGPPLNSQFHNASVNISADGNEVFIYSDAHGGDIYSSFRTSSGSWSAPKALEINTPDIENSATITKDGQRLFFTSNRPGTYGGTDIFTCVKNKNGTWSEAKNLGAVVNSEYDEEDVFISASGKHLYFSSNGHAGMGDLDIYRSIYDSATGVWSVPQNLGYPINSVENDIYFVLSGDEQHAYYSSVKESNRGEQDIYRIDMEQWKPIEVVNTVDVPALPAAPAAVKPSAPLAAVKQKILLDLLVVDDETSAPLPAKVELHANHLLVPVVEKSAGLYHFEWDSKSGVSPRYDLTVNRTGYSAYTSPLHLYFVDLNSSPVIIRDTIRIVKAYVKVGPSEVIPVQFGNNGDVPLTFDGIQTVIARMKENPLIKVEIAGFTDDRGEDDYNLSLSRRRADAVKHALINGGISAERIVAVGYGETKPAVSNATEDGKRRNRRTEFTLIE